MGCPHCGSLDVRRSHTSFGLDRFDFHRCRCRVCHALFWLRSAQLEAVRAQRREREASPDHAVPAEPVVPGPGEPAAPSTTAPDFSALDEELARRRSETPPH